MIEDINKIEVRRLSKMCKLLKDRGIKEVTFEFVVGSLFPKAYKNIKEELKRQYTLGYAAGLKENKTPE